VATKRKPAKSIVSVSITIEATQMLNALADTYTNGNRSRIMEQIIRDQASHQLSLTRVKKHTVPERPEGSFCNPKHKDGKCEICWGGEE
tara:strand:+ start:625 stop:891 length:267 start_codon:yes stop_codon:yes gene_type:complete